MLDPFNWRQTQDANTSLTVVRLLNRQKSPPRRLWKVVGAGACAPMVFCGRRGWGRESKVDESTSFPADQTAMGGQGSQSLAVFDPPW